MFDKKITITTEDLKVEASLNDSETAQKIWKALPIEGSVNTGAMKFIFPYRLMLDWRMRRKWFQKVI